MQNVVTGTNIIIFFGAFVYVGLPSHVEVINKWLWNKKFFWSNYAVTVLLAVTFVVIRWAGIAATSNIIAAPFLLSPFIFYSLYLLFDRIVSRKYNRHFIITNTRFMSKRKWGYDRIDEFFTVFAGLAATLLPLILLFLSMRRHR